MVEIALIVIGVCIISGILLAGLLWLITMKCPNCRSRRIQIVQCTDDMNFPRTRLICTNCYGLYDRFRKGWRRVT